VFKLFFFSFNNRREAVNEDSLQRIDSQFKAILCHKTLTVLLVSFLFLAPAILIINCDSETSPLIFVPTGSPDLDTTDVQLLMAHAVELAERLGAAVAVAVVDREANVLGVFRMTGVTDSDVFNETTGAIAKARTAAYLSSNQHAFTTLTACFITRPHFPPGINNTPGGPLYGVPYSSLGGGDIQPNGDSVMARPGDSLPGLTGVPGGVPIFKGNRLAGGLGVSGGALGFTLNLCQGSSQDEEIALGALAGLSAPDDLRGDRIFIDGIRFLYANTEPRTGNFSLNYSDLASRGGLDSNFDSIRATPIPDFPVEGDVDLSPSYGSSFNFNITGGSILTLAEVQQIINQAAAQAAKTRAAIRRPLGTPAQVFISVVDTNGAVLGIWRTADATIFSFDVSAQKARTAVAFSRSDHPLGIQVRNILGLPAGQQLAVTCRAVGFLSQDFYPPGIDVDTLDKPVAAGPLYQGPEFELQRGLGLRPFGNGITIFPGGCPLFKNGVLAGGIGISGDGVDQDDIICFAGTIGFEPPASIRCDNFFYDDIRLPYVKFPRRPEIDQ